MCQTAMSHSYEEKTQGSIPTPVSLLWPSALVAEAKQHGFSVKRNQVIQFANKMNYTFSLNCLAPQEQEEMAPSDHPPSHVQRAEPFGIETPISSSLITRTNHLTRGKIFVCFPSIFALSAHMWAEQAVRSTGTFLNVMTFFGRFKFLSGLGNLAIWNSSPVDDPPKNVFTFKNVPALRTARSAQIWAERSCRTCNCSHVSRTLPWVNHAMESSPATPIEEEPAKPLLCFDWLLDHVARPAFGGNLCIWQEIGPGKLWLQMQNSS